ncbi:MAG: S-methyl-5-thioribose-1-phosphate isomerase [Gemmatimonadota bacterium]
MHVEALGWTPSGTLRILDQTLLPAEERWLEIATRDALVEAIRSLRVRGAPAIGIAAAMGLVAVLRSRVADDRDAFRAAVERLAEEIAEARPTAVNLRWAMDRMRRRARAAEGDAAVAVDAATTGGADAILAALREEAQAIWDEDRAMCRAIAEHGQALMRPGVRVLTHCNTGALATGGIGTALGIVYRAAERGLDPHVWVDETRPLWQGARLTAWELSRAGIRHAVLPDSAAASLMAEGQVDVVLVGADRVARNGDVANKVGTYALAVLARHHGVAFYSVAPSTSFDPACASGSAIRIEHRNRDEVAVPCGIAVAPADSPVHNPAFDVTPAALVTGYVTERGVLHPPFEE